MRKVYIGINECIPGMRIAEDIFNEYGAIFLTENSILNNYIIDRIGDLGLDKIKIFTEDDKVISADKSKLFRAQYNENLKTIKDMLYDIGKGKRLDPATIRQITDSVLLRINENRDIINCVREIRSAGEYLYTHSINVSFLSMLIGKWMRFDHYIVKSLVTAGFLHDIGKTRIEKNILEKPGPLDIQEKEEMKKHPVFGFKIAESQPGLNEEILKGILMHHEREDGSGYPLGLKDDQISSAGKIIAIADIYDAMTSNRHYKEMLCPFEVIEQMQRNYYGTLDHKILSVFLKNISCYYMGSFVKLNSGAVGEIVYINPFNISKPIVRTGNTYIDLASDKRMKILELI